MTKDLAATLDREIDWFSEVLTTRIDLWFQEECSYSSIFEIAPPDLISDSSTYANFIKRYSMDFAERLVLILSLLPSLRPHALDPLSLKNPLSGRGFTEFGGYWGETHKGVLPTCETAVFILAADSLEERFKIIELFKSSRLFTAKNIIEFGNANEFEPPLSAKLCISTAFLEELFSKNEISL